ncbi:aminodeoxychorismate synthase component I [Sphingomonas japonica]|uniref:Probable branched-chain-amino-acid aminotransferase n=1 Tax=Sphingomonas japonica TaxID=511662 RepID=A0ABX0U5B9_9SPHN|nr:aminodeoxychorismate synthase component I [Sphingomonas japonica]NIJ23973.1 para-aminobenzoate synthetase/4-amino-4-deoxychorismate lyase [Sphingomonas japonica]
MRPTAPFVLLDDARDGDAAARLYHDPVEVIEARLVGDILPALDRIRAAGRAGLHAAGFLAYSAGGAFEATAPQRPGDPLLWFGLFERYDVFDPADLPDPAGAWLGPLDPSIARSAYLQKLAAIQELIRAGDLYQTNLTFQARVQFEGDPFALYARLRAASKAGWGAYVDTGQDRYLSLSPELFFALEAGELTCKPMKGTAPRLADPREDAAAREALRQDPKQRAENLMIVDLMRNDLARVAIPGSVAVPDLFAIEAYPTVQQMVSTVTATLAPGKDAIDVLAALFPCGSITGAPKLRACQTIAEIEGSDRGIYTGSIGRIDPDGGAQFNVAIRTLTVRGDDGYATLGLGSGIVADSNGPAEWEECLTKAAFLKSGGRAFDLIETMAFDPVEGIARLDAHLERMRASAERFGFAFDRHAVRNELQAATFRLRAPAKVRLAGSPSGAIAIEIAPLPAPPDEPVAVAIAPLPVASADFRLRHKTSDRRFYDASRAASGCFEVVYVDPDGFLTEGSFTSLFVERDGRLATPPLSRGLLPGILRGELLASGRATERDLVIADLQQDFWIGNSLRGLLRARLATTPDDR